MSKRFGFRISRSELPIIIAFIILVAGMLCWGRAQQKRTAAMINTRVTLASLQVAYQQYRQLGGLMPKLLKGHPSVYSFLTAYQRFYADHNVAGQWRNNPHLLIYLRPKLTTMGFIPMPDGGTMRGIVAVRDGFGHLIHFLNNPAKNSHAPCFAVKIPMEGGASHWLYSTDEISGY